MLPPFHYKMRCSCLVFEWDIKKNHIVIGVSENLLELAVCHCYRGSNEDVIRIMSARKATSREKKIYERGF
jgi:uncharacterized DUF497 family protein